MIAKGVDFLEEGKVPKDYKYVYVHALSGRLDTLRESIALSIGASAYSVFREIDCFTILIPEKELATLKKLPEIRLVEEVPWRYATTVKTEEYTKYTWNMEMISVKPVHVYNTGVGIKVGVLDSGVDQSHTDLVANYKGGVDFTEFLNLPHTSGPGHDSCGHGTHCAGIIGAVGEHMIGVAPQISLYSIRALEWYEQEGEVGCVGVGDWVVNGIEWAANSGMDVLSMSVGGPPCEAERRMIARVYSTGVCIVASSGNEGANVNTSAPACYDEVISVGAVDMHKVRPQWSNYGVRLDVCAPGVDVYSTMPGNSYAYLSGTSMACPHVSGIAALLRYSSPKLSPGGINRRLGLTAEDLGQEGFDIYYGWGLVNAERAVPKTVVKEPGELPEVPTEPIAPPVERSKLIVLPHGIIFHSPVTLVHDAKSVGQLIVEGDIKQPAELSDYVDLVPRADFATHRELEEEPELIPYGLFYHAEDKSIWIGRRKGSVNAKKGFSFVDTQPFLLERKSSAQDWEDMSEGAKRIEISTRKLRQNNISISKFGKREETAFWCNKKEVCMAKIDKLRTIRRTKRKEDEPEQKVDKIQEATVYRLLNMPDNDQEERIDAYKEYGIPDWEKSTRLKIVPTTPYYWMPTRIVVKECRERWIANYRMEDGKPWKYVALVEEIGSEDVGNFGDDFFRTVKHKIPPPAYPFYCNSEINLYGCTDLNFKDNWKWLATIALAPGVTALYSGTQVYISNIWTGYWTGQWWYDQLATMICKEWHPADEMIQESIAIDKERGTRYLYTMFGLNLRLDKDSELKLSVSHKIPGLRLEGDEEEKDYAGGVVFRIKKIVAGGQVFWNYEKTARFRVLSYMPVGSGDEEKPDDITEKMRILGVYWSDNTMRLHPELKDQVVHGW